MGHGSRSAGRHGAGAPLRRWANHAGPAALRDRAGGRVWFGYFATFLAELILLTVLAPVSLPVTRTETFLPLSALTTW